ncbi:MAG: acyltransferase family protein [Bacteroidetes bacterium]|nr:acyltransferase family protein [Bacteroidota bacterium]
MSGSPQRLHDLDWLRVIAVLLVLFFHVGMFFNPWGWHIKNEETSPLFIYPMHWMHEWRMPLLLFVSGAGTFLALRSRTMPAYAGERFRRLMIPLIVGMLVIVPPQIYIEKSAQYSSFLQFYPSIFTTGPYPAGNLSWHHLWFILYLFLYSVLSIPLLRWLKSDRSEGFYAWLNTWISRPYGFLSGVLVILLTQAILRPFFPEETHGLIDDWAAFTQYYCFFIAGFIFYRSPVIWYSISTHRRIHLATGLISLAVMMTMVSSDYWPWRTFPDWNDAISRFWFINGVLMGWSWVLTIIGYGQAYLNQPHPWLSRLNEGIYPFYILHQTVIILVAAPFISIHWPIWTEYLLISLLSLICTVGIYWFVIMPVPALRFLFGMKTPRPAASKQN